MTSNAGAQYASRANIGFGGTVSLDPYVVFFSNIFAILGLRAMFFLLAELHAELHVLGLHIVVDPSEEAHRLLNEGMETLL